MTDINLLMQNKTTTTERAYAKINLALDVTGRLENGYHLVRMIMESISIYDDLSFICSSNPGIRMSCNVPGLSCGEDNLVVKAAKAVLLEAGIDSGYFGLDIDLQKNIPMAAGMAGGSADAAAVLRALNRLLELNLDTEKLCDIGVKLGADVPYCVRGGSYLSEGIGEILSPLLSPPDGAFVAVIKPNIDVSTKYVYEHLDTEGVEAHPDVDGMMEALAAGNLRGITDRLGNVLRDVTINDYPVVAELEQFLVSKGALGALMSGSGPTVFGIFDSRDKCDCAIRDAETQYPEMFSQTAQFV